MYIVLGFRKNGQSFMKHQGNVQLKLRFVILIACVLYMYIFLVKCLYLILWGGNDHILRMCGTSYSGLSVFFQAGFKYYGPGKEGFEQCLD